MVMESGNLLPDSPGAEAAVESADWRTTLHPESRQKIVVKILDTLKRHIRGLNDLEKVAERFEEKIYTAATSQSDYLRRISLKMLSMESKFVNAMSNSLPPNGGGGGPSNNPPDSDSTVQTGHATGVDWQEEVYQQLGLQQQPNGLQRDMQQRLQATSQPSGSLLQPQNVVDQQKQLYQSQRPHQETSSTSLDFTAQTGHAAGVGWQEEVYQKIKLMKEMYSQELTEMYQKIATKLQQQNSLPQPPKLDSLEKLKIFKTILERLMQFLQTPKNSITPSHKEKLAPYEKQIINFVSTNRPRKPDMLQGQLPPTHMHTLQQSQSQISQVQSHDNQMNPQMQSMNLHGSVGTMQQNNMTTLHHSGMPSVLGVTTAQQNILNSLQSGSNLNSGQGNTMNSLQQVAVGSMPQNSVSASRQTNINSSSSQNAVSMLISSLLQHQHLKQQQEQQMLLAEQLKQQIQLCQMQQQFPAQYPTHHMQRLQQMNNVGDMKVKPEAKFPIPSPQLVQATSPQMPLSSPPCSLLPSTPLASSPILTHHMQQLQQMNSVGDMKVNPGTKFPIPSPQLVQATYSQMPLSSPPLQSATNSPFMLLPSTPLAPSPMLTPGDSEKPISGISSKVGHQQATKGQPAAPVIAIGIPGISSTTPLLAEFSGRDGTHGTAAKTVAGKSEKPLDRSLIRAVISAYILAAICIFVLLMCSVARCL